MKIDSVIVKTIVVINGKEHTIKKVDWTESCLDWKKNWARDGRIFTKKDVIDWVTTY